MVNSNDPPPAVPGSGRYFLMAAWEPDRAPHASTAKPSDSDLNRFLNDWRKRCLPIPWCSATSGAVYDAYRFWARLQGISRAASMNVLVLAACANGLRKSRHRIRFFGRSVTAQHVVLHPSAMGEARSGRQLDEAASAFAAALAGWMQAAGVTETPRKAKP
jgi:hypothetical protein